MRELQGNEAYLTISETDRQAFKCGVTPRSMPGLQKGEGRWSSFNRHCGSRSESYAKESSS
jgi:hypothetical protein